jgi:DNA-binding ferritin-like protein
MREYRGQVTGPNLYSLRRLFDEQRSQLNFWLDRIVERTKSIGLGKRAVATKANQSSAALGVTASLPAHSMIGNLLGEHERIAQHLRHDIERLPDPAMADLLQRLVEFHETTAWMLRVVHTGRESDPSLV